MGVLFFLESRQKQLQGAKEKMRNKVTDILYTNVVFTFFLTVLKNANS